MVQIKCQCGDVFNAKKSAHRKYCSKTCTTKYLQMPSKHKHVLTKEFFEKYYYDDKKCLNEICREFNIHIDTVRFYFHKEKISLRTSSETLKNRKTTDSTKESWKQAGIDRRTGKYFCCKKCHKEYYVESNRIKTDTSFCCFECEFSNVTLDDLKHNKYAPQHLKFIYRKLITREFFLIYYFKQKKSFHTISKEFNVSSGTLGYYFRKHKLKARTPSENGKGRVFSDEHIRKLMLSLSQNVLYKGKTFRSSWEVNFVQWCDLSGIKWRYEPKVFRLKKFTYIPDFYLPEFDLWIEVKGRWIRDSKKKFQCFKKQFPNVALFNGERLREYGIIK